MVGFEPTTGRLRSDYSTPELHRLINCLNHILNTLVEHQEAFLTLAIIPFEYFPCQASVLPFRAFWFTQMEGNHNLDIPNQSSCQGQNPNQENPRNRIFHRK